MSFDEIKEIAKQNNIKFGNISKEKLIEKIKEALSDNNTDNEDIDLINKIFEEEFQDE